MDSDFRKMFKEIALYDFFISLIFATVIYFTIKSYALFFILGVIIALVNLFVNGIITEYSLNGKNVKSTGIIVLGSIIRVIFVGLIGFMIGRHNIYNIIAYIFGYSLQFISLAVYGIKNRNT
ncbi:MAG: ATP synthase subunit I [Clostridium sp.]|uniref:ATP synthase subunit I n=1 Tax=Clostridium sp. TaxID=1506 RepID=UPI003D6D1321